jgi:hemoglobin
MRKLLFVVLLAFAPTTIALADTAPPAAQKSLYDRLGGKPAIQAVVHDFLGNVAADSAINKRFAKTNIPKLEGLLVDQVCQATGGPCAYGGKDMKTAHQGMHITAAEFDALVADLKKSLDKYKVGAKEQSDLLGALGGMKADIVGH